MTAALRDQIPWCLFGLEPNFLVRMNPVRPLVQWYNTRRMNGYITRQLEDRYVTRQGAFKGKSIVDLALNTYVAEHSTNKTVERMDATFEEFAISQIKLFIFAGHGTTASTNCYVYHLLSRHPSALQRIHAEHDTVLGRDLSLTASLITSTPHLLNQLPYTLAVIRETLRLFPVVTAPRAGQPDFFLTGHDGDRYPTENCLVWLNHHALHHNPNFWVQPDDFLPERWLVPADDPLHPVKNAWRPFEFGPRTCIGQELALIEVKMILALTVRDLNVCGAYDEWDRLKGTGKPAAENHVNGERAYQTELESAHPSDGFPCRVQFAKRDD